MTPTSVPGASRSGGFTLVEILVALLVIGIVTAVAALNMSPDDRGAVKTEAANLADLLEETSEDAQDTGSEIAWSGNGSGYSFWKRQDDGSWAEMAGDDFYRSRVLNDGVRIAEVKADGKILPQGKMLLFKPSGVNRTFEIVLEKNGAAMTVSGDALNRVTVQ